MLQCPVIGQFSCFVVTRDQRFQTVSECNGNSRKLIKIEHKQTKIDIFPRRHLRSPGNYCTSLCFYNRLVNNSYRNPGHRRVPRCVQSYFNFDFAQNRRRRQFEPTTLLSRYILKFSCTISSCTSPSCT